jgi:hypothetical protein
MLSGRQRLELYQKIQVAALRIKVLPQSRAEQCQSPHTVLPAKLGKLIALFLDSPFH